MVNISVQFDEIVGKIKPMHAVYLVNLSDVSRKISTNLGEGFRVSLVDAEHYIEQVDLSASELVLGANQIALIEG